MPEDVRAEFERVTEGGIVLGGEYGDAESDLGPVVVFFVGDDSHFVTGQLVPVDGGLISVR